MDRPRASGSLGLGSRARWLARRRRGHLGVRRGEGPRQRRVGLLLAVHFVVRQEVERGLGVGGPRVLGLLVVGGPGVQRLERVVERLAVEAYYWVTTPWVLNLNSILESNALYIH